MSVGRPRQFDREEALGKAMEIFWAKGYETTSVQDLLDAMSINRGSMYATFGDKHALFVAAFEQYVGDFGSRWESVLNSPGSPLGNVRNMLEQVVSTATEPQQRGCMVTNCAVELAARDPFVAQALKGVFRRIRDLVRQTLDRAVEAGELSRDANTRAQSGYVVAMIQGLLVLGKAAHNRKQLNEVVEIAISALK